MKTCPALVASTPAGGVLVGLLDAFGSVLDGLDGVDRGGLSADEAAAGLVGLQRLVDRSTVVLAGFVSTADSMAVWAGSGNKNITGWLAEHSKLGYANAVEVTRLADVLESNATLARKVRDGEISTATATALAPTVMAPPPGVPASEVEVLIEACTNSNPREARAAAELWKSFHETVDDDVLVERRFAKRFLRFAHPVDGIVTFTGQLPTFEAHAVHKTLTAYGGGRPDPDDTRTSEQRVVDGLLTITGQAALAAPTLFSGTRTRWPHPTQTGTRTGAGVGSGDSPEPMLELFHTGHDDPNDDPPDDPPDNGPDDGPDEGPSGGGGPPGDGGGGPPRGPHHGGPPGGCGGERSARVPGGTQAATLLVLVPADTLTGTSDAPAWDEYGHPVPAATARRLATHHLARELVPVIHDGTVVLRVGTSPRARLDLGRSARLRSVAQYAALLARDGHCRWPGCTRPAAWCHVDHAYPWEHGGRTDLDNLWLLCPAHHTEKHRAGTECTLGPLGTNGPVHIRLPNGTTLTSTPSGPITHNSTRNVTPDAISPSGASPPAA